MIAGLLAMMAIVLLAVDELAPVRTSRLLGKADLQGVDRAIDSVFSHYGIATKQIRSWIVKANDGTPLRKERRVLISRDLATVELNRDLNNVVSPFNGHVVGTERTKESVVVLHIVMAGATVESISLVTATE